MTTNDDTPAATEQAAAALERASESAYTQFHSDYKDVLQTLPAELKDKCLTISTLETQVAVLHDDIRRRTHELLQRDHDMTATQALARAQEVIGLFSRCESMSQQKLDLAASMYDAVDRRVQDLDKVLLQLDPDNSIWESHQETVTVITVDSAASSSSAAHTTTSLPLSQPASSLLKRANEKKLRKATAAASPVAAGLADANKIPKRRGRPPKALKKLQQAANDAQPAVVAPAQTQVIFTVPPKASEPVYCICRQASYGLMIECESGECPYEWFHLDCLGMEKAPKGTCSSTGAKLQNTIKAAMTPSASASGGALHHYAGGKGELDAYRQRPKTAVMRLDHNLVSPVTINRRELHDEFFEWATSNVEFCTTARLVPIQSSPGQIKLLADDCDIDASNSQSSFVLVQINDCKIGDLPAEAELLYSISSGDVHIDTKTFVVSEQRARTSDPYVIPFHSNLRIDVVIRFPSKDTSKGNKSPAKNLFGSLKRRLGRDMLDGMEICIASLSFELCPADFGCERFTSKLRIEPFAMAITGRKAEELRADMAVSLGVWTGSTVAREANKRLTHEDFLTIQTNPRSPVWKRFWARTDLEDGTIRLYDFEYREDKAQLLSVSLSSTSTAVLPDAELCYPVHTFQITHCPLTLGGGFNPRASTASLPSQLPLEQLFTSQETLIDQNARPVSSWICRADSAQQMQKWMEVLSDLVAAIKKNEDRLRSKKRLL
ncbi:hypothetical protein RI367_003483 [Sorochytrium milnesiophthora]